MACMTPHFREGTDAKRFLLGKYCAIHLRATGGALQDPFAALCMQCDEDANVFDPTLADSYHHVATHSLSPKQSSYKRLYIDDRDEPKFCADEIKVKVTFPSRRID